MSQVRFLWIAIGLSVVGLSIGWAGTGRTRATHGDEPSVAAPSPDQPAGGSISADSMPADSGVVEEIVRLRARQNLFRGTVFDRDPAAATTDDSAEFRRVLSRIAAESPRVNRATPPPRQQQCETEYEQWIDRDHQPVDARLVSSLRQAARLLDQKANDLEETRQFCEADRFRELAQELRSEARDLESHG